MSDIGNSPILGQNLPRKEGPAKVTGEAQFADDLEFEGCLFGKTIRSEVPRGLIQQIHFDPKIPWREIVIAGASDIPGHNGVQLIDNLQPLLAEGEIRHPAEPLLLLAHPDRELLERAARALRVETVPLPAIFSIEESEKGAVLVDGRDNLYESYQINCGDLESGFAAADLILEEVYRTGAQEQLYIEPNTMIARSRPGREITIWGSMQCPFYIQTALSPLFGLERERIRVIQTETGGAFGGKEEYPNMIAGHAALLSWKAGGKPVKILYDRREDLIATTKRHPSRTRIRAGFKRDGRLTALEIDFDLNAGAYPTLSSVVLSRGILHGFGPYRCPNCRLQARAWATHSVPYGAFRGFGAPQSVFAMETHMSRAAHELGMDPAELRRKNLLQKGDRMPTGQEIREEIDLEGLMERAIEESDYRAKRSRYAASGTSSSSLRKGIGLSVFFHGAGFTGSGEDYLASRLAMTVGKDGQVEILASNVEYGQGTRTTFTQIAAEYCRIPPDWVRIHQPDTAVVENSGPTVASRTSMIVGGLVRKAALQVVDVLRQKGGLPQDYLPADFREASRTFIEEHGPLRVVVQYQAPPGIHWNDETYQGEAYSAYAWSCDVAEVEVDLLDYSARVTDFVSVVECGRVINPLLAAGQIQGGVAQGIGWALYENCLMEEGAMLNHQYTNYIIPTTADVPDIRVRFFSFPSTGDDEPISKGIGELPMSGPAPAIAAAVAQALGGKFIQEVPILPEDILERLSIEETAEGSKK